MAPTIALGVGLDSCSSFHNAGAELDETSPCPKYRALETIRLTEYVKMHYIRWTCIPGHLDQWKYIFLLGHFKTRFNHQSKTLKLYSNHDELL